MIREGHIVLIGAGLVGALMALLLRQRGYKVSVYEKRKDPREWNEVAGRSINLALSHRGIHSLKLAGVFDQVEKLLIPMKGRMMHDRDGALTFQPYGREGQHINSVSRGGLNQLLVQEAEQEGVKFYFGKVCSQVDLEKTRATFVDQGGRQTVEADVIIGSDGAFSVLRSEMQRTDRFNYQQFYIDYGYKELTMPAKPGGKFAMEPNYLHIWPRGNYMLIALPNPDGSFTCTLFFPFEGLVSFDSVDSGQEMEEFFKSHFSDAVPHLSGLLKEFESNPLSSLVTIKCFPWHTHRSMVIGDASHAIVPFYGQGMNAGFEDCRLLIETLEECNDDWSAAMFAFEKSRKPDTDAIADLAIQNFTEMRDWVADEQFLLQKRLESELHRRYPEKWIPQYSMVTFSDIPYSHAQTQGAQQDRMIKKVIAELSQDELNQPDFERLIKRLNI